MFRILAWLRKICIVPTDPLVVRTVWKLITQRSVARLAGFVLLDRALADIRIVVDVFHFVNEFDGAHHIQEVCRPEAHFI